MKGSKDERKARNDEFKRIAEIFGYSAGAIKSNAAVIRCRVSGQRQVLVRWALVALVGACALFPHPAAASCTDACTQLQGLLGGLLAFAQGPMAKLAALILIAGGALSFARGHQLDSNALQLLGSVAVGLGALFVGTRALSDFSSGTSVALATSTPTYFSHIESAIGGVAKSVLGNQTFIGVLFASTLSGTVATFLSEPAHWMRELAYLTVCLGVLGIGLATSTALSGSGGVI